MDKGRDGWIDRWVGEWMSGGWVDGWMGGLMEKKGCVSYFECVPISIQDIDSDLNVLSDALATPLKVSFLQGEVQVVTNVT